MRDTDLIRRAATKIRETVNALPDPHVTWWKPLTLPPDERHTHPLWWVNTDLDTPAMDGTRTDTTIAECVWSGADADHIALWGPMIALAVADWLESEVGLWGPSAENVDDHAHRIACAVLGEDTPTDG